MLFHCITSIACPECIHDIPRPTYKGQNISDRQIYNPVLETDTVSSIFYHEFAHMLDATFDISRDSEIFRILRQIGHDSEEIYYVGRELFADSFAEYYASEHPSQESTDLVSYVNRKYLENRSKEKQSGKRLIKTIQPK